MSTEPLIRELFRNLESNLHERLVMIEQILQAVEKPKVPLYDNEFIGRIEALERQHVDDSRFSALEDMMTKMYVELESLKRQRPSVEPVKVVSTPVEAKAASAVKASTPAAVKAFAPAAPVVKSKAPAPVVPQWEEEPEVEPEAEVEPEVEVEEEEQELELEEFEYKGRTFFKDQNNMVYAADEEGEISTDEPVGQWNGKRIVPVSA